MFVSCRFVTAMEYRPFWKCVHPCVGHGGVVGSEFLGLLRVFQSLVWLMVLRQQVGQAVQCYGVLMVQLHGFAELLDGSRIFPFIHLQLGEQQVAGKVGWVCRNDRGQPRTGIVRLTVDGVQFRQCEVRCDQTWLGGLGGFEGLARPGAVAVGCEKLPQERPPMPDRIR